MRHPTLALDLEDGSVLSDINELTGLGFICQGESGLRTFLRGCLNKTKRKSEEDPSSGTESPITIGVSGLPSGTEKE